MESCDFFLWKKDNKHIHLSIYADTNNMIIVKGTNKLTTKGWSTSSNCDNFSWITTSLRYRLSDSRCNLIHRISKLTIFASRSLEANTGRLCLFCCKKLLPSWRVLSMLSSLVSTSLESFYKMKQDFNVSLYTHTHHLHRFFILSEVTCCYFCATPTKYA